MKKTVVIYESKYGSTRCYAQWIAEELTCLYLSEKNLTRRILQNMTLLYTAEVSMPAV